MNSDCPVCYEHVNRGSGYKFGCGHKVCMKCIFGCKQFKMVRCPLCRHQQNLFESSITTRNLTKFRVECMYMIKLVDKINSEIDIDKKIDAVKEFIKFSLENFLNYSGLIPRSIYFTLKKDILKIKDEVVNIKEFIKIEIYNSFLNDIDTILKKL